MSKELKRVLETSLRIRDNILKDCQITKATLSNWSTEKTPIPFWAKEKINKITQTEIGKELFTI
jgi:hypothetical protein